MTASKSGRSPVPHGMLLRCWAVVESDAPAVFSISCSVDFVSVTRVTPSTSFRRESSRATSVCPGAQPWIVIAGALIAPRSGLAAPPTPPAPFAVSPVSDFSVMSAGMARERSRRTCSQSKRDPAMSLTVCTRALAIESKSA